MGPQDTFKRGCITLLMSRQAEWEAGSRNEAGIQELPVPMPFVQTLSHKDEVWEWEHS